MFSLQSILNTTFTLNSPDSHHITHTLCNTLSCLAWKNVLFEQCFHFYYEHTVQQPRSGSYLSVSLFVTCQKCNVTYLSKSTPTTTRLLTTVRFLADAHTAVSKTFIETFISMHADNHKHLACSNIDSNRISTEALMNVPVQNLSNLDQFVCTVSEVRSAVFLHLVASRLFFPHVMCQFSTLGTNGPFTLVVTFFHSLRMSTLSRAALQGVICGWP